MLVAGTETAPVSEPSWRRTSETPKPRLLIVFSMSPSCVGTPDASVSSSVSAVKLLRADDEKTPEVSMALFRYSITYLMVLFLVLCVDHFWVVDRFWGALL